MKRTIIAFDVDGTLLDNDNSIWEEYYQWNDRITDLLKILSSFKNTKIIVWSWRWKEWAKLITKELSLEKYVNWYAGKNHLWKEDWVHKFEPDIVPDIAIDDIQDCELWVLNLIDKEK